MLCADEDSCRGRGLSGASAPTAEPSFGSDLVDPTPPAEQTSGRGRGRGRDRGRVRDRGIAPATAFQEADPTPPTEPTLSADPTPPTEPNPPADPTPPTEPNPPTRSNPPAHPNNVGRGHGRGRGRGKGIAPVLCSSGNSSSTFPVAYKTISPVSVIDGPTVINIVITPVEADVTESVTPV
ncbi:cell surface glycoprotein 1-like [Daphnia pulicaria]|uniref:cell surface glycoprotein 1-like n=1 Tax=Daphnia pulicaria TaxID=35523 RepID=UPI001EEA761B|nr:cell surface glycoprotein 1-like [Daphnia pulicaria]XP_046641649.1 cell surface glycoprotein 1-like [Daphnia pulicaria]